MYTAILVCSPSGNSTFIVSREVSSNDRETVISMMCREAAIVRGDDETEIQVILTKNGTNDGPPVVCAHWTE